MTEQFENLSIDRVIFHKIFKRDINGIVEPKYNKTCEEISGIEKSTIEERVVDVMGKTSKSMKMDIVQTDIGSVFYYISDFFRTERDDMQFIELSKKITQKLVNAQNNRRIPGGVVMVLDGRTGINREHFIGIIKAEEDNGFTTNDISDGQMTLKYLNNLLLTKNQKIYKVAFIQDKRKDEEIRLPEDVDVYIYDSNNSVNNAEAKATYFYEGFMGCAFPKSSNFVTKDFYTHTKEFVKGYSDFNGEQKMDLFNALYTYMKINVNPVISIKEFSDMYIKDSTAKDNYIKYMSDKKVPSNNIKKDLSLIVSKLKKRRIKFTKNIELTAPAENFRDLIKIEEMEDGTKIEIKAQISSEA